MGKKTWITGFAGGIVVGLLFATTIFTWLIMPFILDYACDC